MTTKSSNPGPTDGEPHEPAGAAFFSSDPAGAPGGRKRRLRRRILVVDDDEGCLASVESCLEIEGYEVFTATRGLEALDRARVLKAERRRLDLSILDFNMPDLSGIETFLRLLEEMPGLPGIFISGDPSAALADLVRDAGGFALVRKPLDTARLRGAVRDVVLGGAGSPWESIGE